MIISEKLLKELKGLADIYDALEEPYKMKAYTRAYITLNIMKENNEEIPNTEKELIKIKGIGKGIAKKIIAFKKDGYIKEYKTLTEDDKVKKIIDLTSLYGFGIKGAKKLYAQGITTIEDLKENYLNGKIKLNSNQILGIQYYEDLKKRVPREEIKKVHSSLKRYSKINKDIKELEILGSYRRGEKTSGDYDIMVTGKSPKIINDVLDFLTKKYKYVGTLSKGKYKFMGIFIFDKIGRHVDIIFAPEKEYPYKKLYFTGSKEHNIMMRNVAISMGLKLSDKGLFDKDNNFIPAKDEREIFKHLKIKYVKPSDRD